MTERGPNRAANTVQLRKGQPNDNLDAYLRQIGALFDVPKIVQEPQDIPRMIEYYRTIRLPLLAFYDRDGFFHYGISYDGKYKREDLREALRLVEKYLRDVQAKNVLELGCGRGANTAFLARRNPQVSFEALDVSYEPLRSYATLPNAHFGLRDFHDLRCLGNNSYDLAFVIEALSCSTDKPQVLHEVNEKLKRDGLLIVIDGYQRDRASPLTQSEKIMWELIEKSLSVDKIECVSDVETYMRNEFSIIASQDLSPYVVPSSMRFVSAARFYFKSRTEHKNA